MFFRPLYIMAVRSLTYIKNSFALRHRQGECGWTGGHMYICTYNSVVYHQKLKIFFLKLCLVSDLSHRKSNFRFIWWFRVVSDLSPTLGKIGHQWFFKKKWYPWWQNQWFRLCKQWSHNSYKLFWRKNPQKILLSIFNFDLNVNKCPILPLFTVHIWPGLKETFCVLSMIQSVEDKRFARKRLMQKDSYKKTGWNRFVRVSSHITMM
jgi:hypothetical protein